MIELKRLCYKELSNQKTDLFRILQKSEETGKKLDSEHVLKNSEEHRVKLETIFLQFRERNKKKEISEEESHIKKEFSGMIMDFTDVIKKAAKENKIVDIASLSECLETRSIKILDWIISIENKKNKGWFK